MLKDLIDKLLIDLEMNQDEMAEEEGRITIDLDENLSVSFSELSPKGIGMFSVLGPCPKMKQEELFTTLMTSNLFGDQTGGAIIGLDSQGKNVTMRLDIPRQLTYSEFYGDVENFLNYVDFWQQELQEHIKQSEGKSDLLH
ncbi:MAG: hypothetical protein ACI8RA_001415 [Chlamydiales bacterium]|jgi:hypothetical protein